MSLYLYRGPSRAQTANVYALDVSSICLLKGQFVLRSPASYHWLGVRSGGAVGNGVSGPAVGRGPGTALVGSTSSGMLRFLLESGTCSGKISSGLAGSTRRFTIAPSR